MKIKDGQPCHRYTTHNFWMEWTRLHYSSGTPFDSSRRAADKHVIRSESVQSQLLKELAR